MAELLAAGVPSLTPEGVWFSRRMVRDQSVLEARIEGGKLGAEHGIKGGEYGKLGGRPRKNTETPLKPPPAARQTANCKSKLQKQTALLGFDKFWEIYPRKVGKGDAEKAWRGSGAGNDAEIRNRILTQARAYSERRAGEDSKYTPYPATWLNRRQWEDAPDGQSEFNGNAEKDFYEAHPLPIHPAVAAAKAGKA